MIYKMKKYVNERENANVYKNVKNINALAHFCHDACDLDHAFGCCLL